MTETEKAHTANETETSQYLRDGERLDDLLVNGLKIIQNPSAFCFGCDAVEIANFVTGGAKDRAVDLGSGTGIITLLLGGKKGIRCTGVEIQPYGGNVAAEYRNERAGRRLRYY